MFFYALLSSVLRAIILPCTATDGRTRCSRAMILQGDHKQEMKNNRIHTILIALALSMTMLVGCGKSGSAEVSTAPTAAPVPTGAAEPAASPEAVIAAEQQPAAPQEAPVPAAQTAAPVSTPPAPASQTAAPVSAPPAPAVTPDTQVTVQPAPAASSAPQIRALPANGLPA